jgi:hypothetical protein
MRPKAVRIPSLFLILVGTSRCDVPARVQRAERLYKGVCVREKSCAAERGADSAARCPYQEQCQDALGKALIVPLPSDGREAPR